MAMLAPRWHFSGILRALVGHVGAKMANKTGKMANMRGKMGARRRKGIPIQKDVEAQKLDDYTPSGLTARWRIFVCSI